jgi:hypothetical protein
MKIRNSTLRADGRIDCEIEHPEYGWVSFTADPNDSEQHGREIFAVLSAAGPAKRQIEADIDVRSNQRKQADENADLRARLTALETARKEGR